MTKTELAKQKIAEKRAAPAAPDEVAAAAPAAAKPKGPAQTPPDPRSKTQLRKAGKLPCGPAGNKVRERLPDGATFAATWDAAAAAWNGTLVVEGETFQAQRSGLRPLLGALDDLYRAWKAKQLEASDTPSAAGRPGLAGAGA